MNNLPPGWSYQKLNKLGLVGRGRSRNRPRNEPSLYGGPYPFFQTGDVKAAELYLHEYSQTYNEKGLAQSKLWEPGVLLITIAANIAESAILGIRGCFPDSIVGFIADPNKSDVRFVKYALDTLKLQMQSISRGTTQDNLSLDKLLSIDIPTPPLPTQRKIAAILSAYDDLIENNTRRIALLEELAQLLYREWFVRFRFPGHADVPLVESALGPLPQGWEVKRLEEICDLTMGQSPKSEFYNEDADGLPFHQGVTDFGNWFPQTRMYCTELNRVAEDGDILFSVRAPVGRINVADRRIVIGRGLSAIHSKTGNQGFMLFQLKEKFQEEDSMGGGTIFKAVTKADMQGILLIVPSQKLVIEFERMADSVLQQIRNLTYRNTLLRTTRDLLLPRLISGAVAVG